MVPEIIYLDSETSLGIAEIERVFAKHGVAKSVFGLFQQQVRGKAMNCGSVIPRAFGALLCTLDL